jgi:hypothetical protein
MPPQRFEVAPPEQVRQEIESRGVNVDKLVREAEKYLTESDEDVDELAISRMFIERGYSDDLAHWLVREADVRRAPG